MQFFEAVQKVKSDNRYKPEFDYAIVKHKTRKLY